MLNNIINATNINKTFADAILLCIFASENTVLAVCHIIKQVANITTIMLNTKFNRDKNAIIVRRVALVDTLRAINHHTECNFKRDELTSSEFSLKATINRLNKTLGTAEFSYSLDPLDGSFWIRRL